MRFMIIVKANADTEAGRFPPDMDKLMAQMGAFHDELAQAGVLLDASGLHTLIQVRSREEALEWSRRYRNPVREGAVAEIEVRQLDELEDFATNLEE